MSQNSSHTTQDHDVIRKWAEERGGKPSHVKSTANKKDIGILRLDFPGYSGQGSLEEIEWDQFFEKFDERGLALVYQEKTAAGERSNFNKLVSAENVEVEHGSEDHEHSSSTKHDKAESKKSETHNKTEKHSSASESKSASHGKAAPAKKTAGASHTKAKGTHA